MTKPNDGGSAFPMAVKPDSDGIYLFKPGMSLRAWLAGQALHVRLSEDTRPRKHERAIEAVALADAMIVELEKEKEMEDETNNDDGDSPDVVCGMRTPLEQRCFDLGRKLGAAREHRESELAEQAAKDIVNAIGDAIDQSAAAGEADHNDGAG